MKKLLALILTVVAAITLFSACAKEEKVMISDEESVNIGLDKRTAEKIKRDYGKLNSTSPNEIRIQKYGGTYNGAVVVMLSDGRSFYPQAVYTYMIGGVKAGYSDGNSYLVWYKGKFYTMQIAYNKGILTSDDIKKVFGVSPDAPVIDPNAGDAELDKAVSAEVKEQIKRAYAEQIVNSGYYHPNSSPEDIKVNIGQFRGSYNGAVAVTLWCDCHPYELWRALATEIGEVSIVYKDERPIYIWNDGKLYYINTAYNESIITVDDIKKIAAYTWEGDRSGITEADIDGITEMIAGPSWGSNITITDPEQIRNICLAIIDVINTNNLAFERESDTIILSCSAFKWAYYVTENTLILDNYKILAMTDEQSARIHEALGIERS